MGNHPHLDFRAQQLKVFLRYAGHQLVPELTLHLLEIQVGLGQDRELGLQLLVALLELLNLGLEVKGNLELFFRVMMVV